jgi:hypothetical protein
LLRSERSIVTPHPGTTRDFIEAELEIAGLRVTLVDTAGVAPASDPVEREGVRRALDAARDADLVVSLEPVAEGGEDRPEAPPGVPVLRLRTKVDLVAGEWTPGETDEVAVSALTGQGWERFEERFEAMLREEVDLPEGEIAVNARQAAALEEALGAVGRMRLEEASMETIRTYINMHPDERREILFTNPSYIFFHWSTASGVTGNLGRSLTPGRSIAVDQGCFPAASLAFLKTRQPVIVSGKIIGWQPVHRFVLIQDTGSALKGPGRVDLFQGTGEQAGLLAGSMKETGSLFFFLLRPQKP